MSARKAVTSILRSNRWANSWVDARNGRHRLAHTSEPHADAQGEEKRCDWAIRQKRLLAPSGPILLVAG
jgi:hypothetical protein